METTSPDDLLTAGEAAALLRCERRTVAAYRRLGTLKAVRYSARKYMFRRGEVERFKREGSTP